jgi:predicted amidohydrolase YtcJ
MRLDLILENLTARTLDPGTPSARRIGIWNGRIAALDDELDGVTATETVDLGGATVVPGFIDAHTHLQLTGQGMRAIDVSGATTPDEAVALIRSGSAGFAADAWVEISGYDQRAIGRHLTAVELDAATDGRRAWARHISSHASVVSSAVLAAIPEDVVAGIPGAADGLLEEGDQRWALDQRLPYSLDDVVATVVTAAEAARRTGVTFCMDAGAGGSIGSLNPLDVSAYLRLRENGGVPVRIQLMPSWDALHPVRGGHGDGFERGLDLGVSTGFGDDMLHIGALKFVLDGGMMVRTARMSEPYEGTDERGVFRTDRAEMIEQIVDAHLAGWQLAVHAIGDEAVDAAIEGFRRGRAAGARTDRRHRIEHGGLIRPDQLAELAELGVAIVGQPCFIHDSGDDFARQMGPRRAPWLYRGRSLLDAGIPLVASTDRPLAGSPLQGIQTMVTRRSRTGASIGPAEAVTPLEALHAWTTAGAWAAGMEDRLGVIRPGALADLTVLGADPVTGPVEGIADIAVRATVIDGELRAC